MAYRVFFGGLQRSAAGHATLGGREAGKNIRAARTVEEQGAEDGTGCVILAAEAWFSIGRGCIEQNFLLFFRQRRNFSSVSGRETSLVNRNPSRKLEFDFRSDKLLVGLLSGFRVVSHHRSRRVGLLGIRRLGWRGILGCIGFTAAS